MDAPPTRASYGRLGDPELELVRLDREETGDAEIELGCSGSRGPSAHHSADPVCSVTSPGASRGARGGGIMTSVLACTVAAGVQFGWALQLSLLTPYIQTLGIEHAFSSFIWLCGPITGLVVQPCVGIWSDKCHSKYGRRRPFILIGSLMISIAVTIIGFSADIGYIMGDTSEHCSTYNGPRWRAAAVFVIGFWLLDLANNTVQGPARALLADCSGPNQCNSANAIFCSWMAIGNILGFSAGANGQWHRWFPFLTTRACCEACGNLKAAFLVSVAFLMFCTSVTLYFAKEVPLYRKQAKCLPDYSPLLTKDSQQSGYLNLSRKTERPHDVQRIGSKRMAVSSDHDLKDSQMEVFSEGPSDVMVNLLTSLRHLPSGMFAVLLVTALTWLSWFPFFLFDTDWMGREVYNGNPNGNSNEIETYDRGVREGAFGLLLNSVVLLISSFLVEPMCKRMGARTVWAISNFIICIGMAATAVISSWSLSENSRGIQHALKDNSGIKFAALILFALLGFPLSVTFSVPFSMTAELTAGAGGGQGLATGVLNLAIVIPQMIISLGAGPWDALFGGGNVPAFILASIFSFAGGILATSKLPKLSYRSAGFHGFG